MSSTKNILPDIRTCLEAILSSSYNEQRLNELVKLCHGLAISFLKSKRASGRLTKNLLGIDLTDLGYDCIADLFQRDQYGNLVQLKIYFEGFPVSSMSNEELIAQLRRLVFSKVNINLFRLYNEIDPTLGRILRNIKIALQTLNNFTEFERFGESYIAPSCCDPLLNLPEYPIELLEVDMRATGDETNIIPSLLSTLSRIIREQNTYSRSLPIIMVAKVFRSVFGSPAISDIQRPEVEETLMEEDIRLLIREACKHVREKMAIKYVGKRKVCTEVYESYFTVIERRLHAVLIFQNGEGFSYQRELQRHIEGLTKEEYSRKHKNILEYLGRCVEERLRNIFSSGD
ncbi:MAG: hypothetical protein V1799_03645 [bacterium]